MALLIRKASPEGTRRQISVNPTVWGFLMSSNISHLLDLFGIPTFLPVIEQYPPLHLQDNRAW